MTKKKNSPEKAESLIVRYLMIKYLRIKGGCLAVLRERFWPESVTV